jgi:hypothetical protein
MYVHRRIDPNERFRERRRRSIRRKRLRRAAVAAGLLAVVAGIVLGASFFTGGDSKTAAGVTAPTSRALPKVPDEIRGIHVTLGLASLPGKLGEYLAMRAYGLNTLELDVKDENGSIGFTSPDLPDLASEIGAAGTHYDEIAAAQAAADDGGTHRPRRRLR